MLDCISYWRSRMKLRSKQIHGFQVITVEEDSTLSTDFSLLTDAITHSLEKGTRRFAIAFAIGLYPYSKLIAYLVQLNKKVLQYNGVLVILRPNKHFLHALALTKLDKVIQYVEDEEDLKDLGADLGSSGHLDSAR